MTSSVSDPTEKRRRRFRGNKTIISENGILAAKTMTMGASDMLCYASGESKWPNAQAAAGWC